MNFLERIVYHPAGGQFRESVGLATYLAPRDLSLYRNLLPQPLGMPTRPTICIYVIDFIKVVPWPATRYQEWSVLLQSSYQGQEAWYPVTMPVTAWLPMKGGHHLGFPKYIADKIALSKEGDTITGIAVHKGATQLELTFSPGHSRQLAPWEKELVDSEAFPTCYCLVPPGVGPRVLKVELGHVVPAKWDRQHGMITVRADPSSSWAGLLPEEGPFPGTYTHFIGGVNLNADRLA